jgi:hypothetical protein
VVEHALEVEGLSLLEYVDVKSGEGNVFELNGISKEFEEAGFSVEGVETGEDILAVVLVECKSEDGYMAAVDVDGDVVDMHLATYQFLAVTVDVALGDG